MKAKKGILVAVAALVVIAAVVVLALGFSKGWFKKDADGNGKEKGKEQYSVSYVYGDDGESVMEEAYYDKAGELQYKVEKAYADTENKVLLEERYVDADNALQKKIRYDENSKIVAVDEYEGTLVVAHYDYADGKETGTHYTYTYTDDGQPLTSVEYDKDDNVVRKIERTYKAYNGKNEITLYLEQDGKGTQISKTVYNRDKDGKEIKTVFYNAEGITGYVTYTYDAKGNKTRMDEYEKDVLTKYTLFKYDKNGGVTQEEHFPDSEKAAD